jgi:mRNA-degrading endonuclease RelE of RelBE toxin-antitoxin system
MFNPSEPPQKYTLVIPDEFETILKKLKRSKPSLLQDLQKAIRKVSRDPLLGKPLRNVLRMHRRVHIGAFVLMYEIKGDEIRLLDFDHHDKVYKRSS